MLGLIQLIEGCFVFVFLFFSKLAWQRDKQSDFLTNQLVQNYFFSTLSPQHNGLIVFNPTSACDATSASLVTPGCDSISHDAPPHRRWAAAASFERSWRRKKEERDTDTRGLTGRWEPAQVRATRWTRAGVWSRMVFGRAEISGY